MDCDCADWGARLVREPIEIADVFLMGMSSNDGRDWRFQLLKTRLGEPGSDCRCVVEHRGEQFAEDRELYSATSGCRKRIVNLPLRSYLR